MTTRAVFLSITLTVIFISCLNFLVAKDTTGRNKRYIIFPSGGSYKVNNTKINFDEGGLGDFYLLTWINI